MKKSKSILLCSLFAATLAAVPQARAQVPVSTALANLKVNMDSVEADLASAKLDRIHHFAEGINASVQDLDKDPGLPEAKKKRVQGYVKNIAKLTDAMHDAADGKNLDETKKEEKKLKSQVDLLAKQFSISGKAKAANPDTTMNGQSNH